MFFMIDQTRVARSIAGRASRALALAAIALLALTAQAAREREPNEVFQARRAALRAKVDGPVVMFGYTGRENTSPSYIFQQEHNFYYLTGHPQDGAAPPPHRRRHDQQPAKHLGIFQSQIQ